MWKLNNSVGTLRHEFYAATVDLRRPDFGIHALEIHDSKLPEAKLLAIDLQDSSPPAIDEAYVRGDDLVATYEQTEPRSFCPQVNWRVLAEEQSRFGFELLFSAQTSLLDSDPSVKLRSHLLAESACVFAGPSADIQKIDAGALLTFSNPDRVSAVLVRLANVAWSYVELLNDSDFHQLEISRADSVAQLSYRLFPERLEKGVIRRARARGLFVPRDGDEQAARECVQQLADADPPLTT